MKNILKKRIEKLNLLQGNYYIFSATSFPFPIQRAVIIDKEGFSKMINPEEFKTRSQDLVEAYHDAGQFYYAKKRYLV